MTMQIMESTLSGVAIEDSRLFEVNDSAATIQKRVRNMCTFRIAIVARTRSVS